MMADKPEVPWLFPEERRESPDGSQNELKDLWVLIFQIVIHQSGYKQKT